MKKAGELARNYQPSKEYGEPTLTNSKTMARFWLRMAEMYGHKWTAAQGEQPTETWSKALSALSADEIKTGLRACLTNGEAWPPSLPQFVALCRPRRRENARAYVWAGPALPHKLSDEQRDKGRQQIAEMRRSLA